MTPPRALLTSIAATAIAFAVAIGVAAGSFYGVNTSQSAAFAQTSSTRDGTLSGTSLDGRLLGLTPTGEAVPDA